jgi:hypothetical protein
MIPVGFEPPISAREKSQTYAFLCTAYKSNAYINYWAGKEIHYFFKFEEWLRPSQNSLIGPYGPIIVKGGVDCSVTRKIISYNLPGLNESIYRAALILQS